MQSLILGLLFIPVISAAQSIKLNVNYLEPESIVEYAPDKGRQFYSHNLRIYCYRGKPKYLLHLFHTIILNLECDHDAFTQYEGGTPEMVLKHHEDEKSIFSFNLLSNNKKKVMKLNPFNQTCIGISSDSPYKVKLNLIRIDFWKVILLSVGLFTFLTAATLSNNSLFYYLCGIFLGIFASFLVVVYMGSKLFPKKPMMYGVMVGGWTLGIYFAQMLLDNIRVIFVTYQIYVFWYVLITGFISFVICYRLGPPKNQRSKNLIKWSLQLAALICIFFSSYFQEAAAGICVAVALAHYFPKRYVTKTRSLWMKRFPPKRKLLTEEEFEEQGVRETTKALEELRKYCGSPECKQWSTMLKLKEPSRFASFMEGSSHLIDEEILEYETSNANIDYSEDESENEEVAANGNGAQENRAYSKFARHNHNGGNLNSTSTPTTRGNHSASRIGVTKRNVTSNRDAAEISEDDEY